MNEEEDLMQEQEEDDEEEYERDGNDGEYNDDLEYAEVAEEEGVEVCLKVRRCQPRKKKKLKSVEMMGEFNEDEEETEEGDEQADDEEEYEESETPESISEYSTILSAVPFEWEEEYYEFTDLCDPGTMEFIEILPEVEIPVEVNASEKYLRICDSLQISPIIKFYNNLETTKIDLTYHGISSKQMRAAAAALEINSTVEELILKGNPLSPESCSFLAKALLQNKTLTTLDMNGCRIGPEGSAALSLFLGNNRTLKKLNLSKCYIEDEGMIDLAMVLEGNTSLQELILSHNALGAGAAEAFAALFVSNQTISFIDLDYNYLYNPVAMTKFFICLSKNKGVTTLSLKWNAISSKDIGNSLTQVFRINKTLTSLDLSDNRLNTLSVRQLRKGLASSKRIEILRLARNPISAEDAEYLLPGLKLSPTLKVLDIRDVWVNKDFSKKLGKILLQKELEVLIGGIYSNYTINGPDYSALLLKRARFEAMKPKSRKKRKDLAHFVFMLGDDPLTPDQFMDIVAKFNSKINSQIFPELMKQFTIRKTNTIDVVALRNKYISLFPDSTPPLPKNSKKNEEQQVIEEAEGEQKENTVEDVVAAAAEEEEEEEEEITEKNEQENGMEKLSL